MGVCATALQHILCGTALAVEKLSVYVMTSGTMIPSYSEKEVRSTSHYPSFVFQNYQGYALEHFVWPHHMKVLFLSQIYCHANRMATVSDVHSFCWTTQIGW